MQYGGQRGIGWLTWPPSSIPTSKSFKTLNVIAYKNETITIIFDYSIILDLLKSLKLETKDRVIM